MSADIREAPPAEESPAVKRMSNARAELSAIQDAFRLLDGLSDAGKIRALDWLHSALRGRDFGEREVPF